MTTEQMKIENYKKFIADFFEKNYYELLDIAKKDCVNTCFNPLDVLSELFIYLSENQQKIENLKELEHKDGYNKLPIMRFSAQWIYSQIRLFTANTGLSNLQSKFGEKKQNFYENNNQKKEEEYEEKYEQEIEDIYSKDELSEDQKRKLKIIQKVYENDLSEVEKILFTTYYIDQNKKKKINEKHSEISNYSMTKMLSDLKNKIKISVLKYK